MKFKFSLLFILFVTQISFTQGLYDINTVQKIEITFDDSNWDFRLDTAKAGSESYLLASKLLINGVAFDSVGVKYKGNSTYKANQTKNPFHIELDTYKDHSYDGYTDIKLSNVAFDPSFVREVLSYQVLRKYMHAPLSNFANVYVNGQLMGLYSNSESISKKFVKSRFNSKDNTFVKCNPIDGAGPGSSAKPSLEYLGTDSTKYYAAYEMKSDYGWKELIGLCDTLKNNKKSIESILDVDRAIWMLAFNNVLVNIDSYSGEFAQNYYLYKDDNGRFNPVVWDLNMSFGTFTQTGTTNLSSTTSKQKLTHLLHQSDAAWPLIQQLLSVPEYKRKYIAHMKTMLSENFSTDSYYLEAKKMQTLIDASVQADVNKFYTYAQFVSNLTTDISGGGGGPGGGSISGIKALMDGRNTYLSTLADFTASAPAVTNLKPSTETPQIGSEVTFTATITDVVDAYVGYRFDIYDKFTKVRMYDDGNHNDGIAGDNVYGAVISMSDYNMQYYVYADNAAAGIFLPARAEHEFYSLRGSIDAVIKGDLVINEFMADNGTTVADAEGKYDDWVELFNNTNTELSLDNLYLSDSYSSPLKWKFPDGTTIKAKGYLIVWADDETSTEGLHGSFKLSSSGENLILSYADGYLVDSLTFGKQTKDISYLRCPNGTGDFKEFKPSFGTENCLTVSTNDWAISNTKVFPNPTNGMITISNGDNQTITSVKIYDLLGRLTQQHNDLQTSTISIDVSALTQGIYMIDVNGKSRHKLIKE